MRILGIDPGYAIMGYGVLDYIGNKFTAVAYGSITTDAHTPAEARLKILYDELTAIIEEYRPDFIYIHNPYDGGNKITSVYPDYYAKKLKDITDCLIYVPYFVLGEINNPYDLNELKSMEHFCLVAGVVYSHKVYVQSENMRRAYITVLTNNFKNEVLTEEYWESKIEVLKSPKITKLQNMIKTFDISSVPENWRKYKEGGNEENNCKKVVFYNTSVSQVLKNPDAVLKKIKSVLKVFFENKNIAKFTDRKFSKYHLS